MEEFNDKPTFGQKIIVFFKNNFDTLAILLISIVYIFAGVLKIVPSGKSISSIIAGSFINLVVGILIKAILRNRGLRDGMNSEVFINTTKLYGQKLDNNTDKITKLDMYCDYRNDKSLIRKQTRYLRKNGLNYQDFIDGKYNNDKELEKVIKHCRNLKIFIITSTMMLNAINIVDAEDKISNMTPTQYQAKGITSNLLIGLLCAVVFAYYIPEAGSFDIKVIMWASLQVTINIAFGVMGYYGAVNFVKNDLRTRVKFIINCFDEFETLDKEHYFDEKDRKENSDAKQYVCEQKESEQCPNYNTQPSGSSI